MEKLAKAVRLAAKIREESFDKKAADTATNKDRIVDFEVFYRVSLMEAADQAAKQVGFNTQGTMPVYLLLKNCWNDILDWSENITKRRKEQMRTIKEILMDRDRMTAEEAKTLIEEAKTDLQERLAEGKMPFNICEEWFGLEPDYIMELL